MWPADSYSFDSDFARTLARKFEHGRLLIVGAAPRNLLSRFAEAGREAETWSQEELISNLGRGEGQGRFQTAVWFYPSAVDDDERMAQGLSHCADTIVLMPGPGADAAVRRLELIQCFSRFGFMADYECDLTDLDPAAVSLRYLPNKADSELLPTAETAFAKLAKHLGGLRRALRARTSELEAAHRHIATLEEKLLKLKLYQRELKLLKAQRKTLRKSPERRVGQVLLAPYRVPERLAKILWEKFHRGGRTRKGSPEPNEYQKWFEQHRAGAQDLERMCYEARTFVSQPLVSILTPVFNTPVPWLREAAESALAQVYENWELVLIDDGSTAAELLRALPMLANSDRRIHLVRLESHQGISTALNRGLAAANGEWTTFLDHDDVLEPDALFQNIKWLQENSGVDLIYSDEDKLTDHGFDSPILKPDWSPDFFLSCNYLCHMIFLRTKLVQEVGGFRSAFDGSQDYDLLLRIIERTNRIAHIPQVLYHWRRSDSSSASNVRQKPGQLDASQHAIEEYLTRRGERAHVTIDWRTHAFCVRRELLEPRKISIVVAAGHGPELLEKCVESLISKTSYPNYEIVIVKAGNKSPGSSNYVSRLPHRSLYFSGAANNSAARNYAVQQTDSPWLLFLDEGIEVIEPEWLTIMAEHVQRPEVGTVGARLINANGTIEHAGIIVGVDGIAQSAFPGFPAEHPGVNRQLQMTRNYSAVSAACMLMRRDVFEQIGGFDETLSGILADVDLCLKIGRAGYLVVYTPLAKLHWAAPASDTAGISDEAAIRQRWSDVLERDPYYNPNLSRARADFSLGDSQKYVRETA